MGCVDQRFFNRGEDTRTATSGSEIVRVLCSLVQLAAHQLGRVPAHRPVAVSAKIWQSSSLKTLSRHQRTGLVPRFQTFSRTHTVLGRKLFVTQRLERGAKKHKKPYAGQAHTYSILVSHSSSIR